MRKRASKRRVWARFMIGKFVSDQDMIRHNLDYRCADYDILPEYDSLFLMVRREYPRHTGNKGAPK